MDHITVSMALRQQLQVLCKSWVKSHLVSRKRTPEDTYWEDDYADEENQDTLNDLNQRSSFWDPDDKCSSEVQHLRQLAVKCPENLTDQFICSYLQQLRVVDKGVTEVDPQLLKFQNLEELVLSANKLKTVYSENLPRKLKILELCSNHISSLKDLSINPPPLLQHVGLAYNKIHCSSESIFLTVDIWPNLVSLDLSFNYLTDLFSLISRIYTLQNLRILVLQGNPLALITTYRGYTIDCLPKLCILDDILILPDEKYKFSGISENKEALENKAKFCVSIRKMQGIPNPNIQTEQQNSADYPITTITYHVCYEFIDDQPSSEMTECQPYMSNQLHQMIPEGNVEQLYPLNLHTAPAVAVHSSVHHRSVERNATASFSGTTEEPRRSLAFKVQVPVLGGGSLTVLSWTPKRDLSNLSWPRDSEEIAAVPKLDKKVGGKNKEKEKSRSSSRGSKTAGKSKKKKENLLEMHHDPPVVKTLGSAVMSLKNLVSGEMKIFSVCKLEPINSIIELQNANDKSPHTNKTKEHKLKSCRENVETPKTTRYSSGKEKLKDADTKLTKEEPPPSPPVLTVEVEVQLMCS